MSHSREENLRRLREEAYVIAPGQKFEVDYFRPEDAIGVARLYYAIYGEIFPVDHVYDPEELVRINQGDDLFQVVGRTPGGDIVGLYALFRSAPGRRIMEAGSWMVHPDYRNTSVGLRMVRQIHNNPPEHLGLNAIYGQSVCDILTTQKLARVVSGHHCALEIEPMPPRPGEAGAYGRISLLDGLVLMGDRPDEIYLPEQYDAQLRGIYKDLELERTFVRDMAGAEGLAASGPVEYSVQAFGESDVAKMEVSTLGSDLAERIAEMERDYPGRHAYQLVLPLWLPGSSTAVAAAKKQGYFFGGLLPLWFDRDALLMQKVAGSPDLSKPLLLTDMAKAIMQMIESDLRTLPSAAS
ncbi:hypothetical protein [Pseudodesulfovibrio sp.]|uniref:hypothetical protein n=1 Tax=unclassified Pseudodesulfovibrio TaxID=2661612 RepID=UPI003B0068C1